MRLDKPTFPSLLPPFISFSLFHVIPERIRDGKFDLTVCVRTKVLFYKKFTLTQWCDEAAAKSK